MRVRNIVLITAAIFIIVPVMLLAFVNTPPGRLAFSSLASRWSEREVRFNGTFYPRYAWPLSWHISDVTIANKDGMQHPNMAEIGSMSVTLGTKALTRGHVYIKRLALVDSNVHLERNAQGVANWSMSPSEEDSALPSLGNIYLENSTLTYRDVRQKTDTSLTATTQGEHFAVVGDGMYLGQKFSLSGNIAATCFARRAKSCPMESSLQVGYTSVRLKGSLNELVPPVGADFMLEIKGADASELFPLFGIVLPPTAPYQLAGHLTYKNDNWHFDDFTGKMGQSDLQGSALWEGGRERPKLTANLISKSLRLEDLGPLIGLAPEQRLSEEQKRLGARQAASPYIIPDIPLDITRLSSMDAEVEFTGKKVISQNLPLDDFYMKITLDDRLMKLTPLRFGTANGNISANIITNARQSPVAQSADINFNRLSLAGLLGGVGKSLNVEKPEGYIGGTLALKGRGKSAREVLGNAHGVSGFGMEGGSVSNLLIKLLSLDIARSLGFLLTGDKPLGIRCVVASFDLDQGVMSADTFVIDTEDTNITAKGTVNLGTEKLDLQLLPAPKKASVLSLRSPINLTGTLKHPKVSLEKGPIAARGGIAAGLAVLAPVAAALAFIDTGRGEDSDCTALIRHMNAKTGKTTKTDEVPNNPRSPEE